MTQPQPQSQPQPQPHPIKSMSVFQFLSQYIQAAASGSRDSLFHLFVAVFTSARATVECLAQHYQAHPRALTLDKLARLNYCAARLKAILYTLSHAPARFLKPAQLRALTRARVILAHIWRQSVDFSPLTPFLTSPENCPPPPRSVVAPASCRHESCHTGAAQRTSTVDPLLLSSPGRALASVLLQLAAIYGLSASPRRLPSVPSSSVPTDPEDHPNDSYSTPSPPASNPPADSLSPSLRVSASSPLRVSPLRPPP